jgi:hypothetical protein
LPRKASSGHELPGKLLSDKEDDPKTHAHMLVAIIAVAASREHFADTGQVDHRIGFRDQDHSDRAGTLR